MAGGGGRRLRVGLIGTGVGLRTYVPGFASTGRADVLAVSGSSPARTRQSAARAGIPRAYGDYRDLCADPDLDVLCVASPNEFHLEHYVAAAASGRHVLIEKPPAVSLMELEEFLRVPIGPGQLVVVDHQLRFNPYLRVLRECVLSGALGRPYSVRVHQQGVGLLAPDVPYSWRFDAARGGGVRLAMGTHLVDLVLFLLGGPRVESVFGTVDVVVPYRTDDTGTRRRVDAGSAFSAVLRFAETTATLSASAAAATDTLFDVDILGTAGEAHFSLSDKLWVSTAAGERRRALPDFVDPDELRNTKSIFKTSFNGLAAALTRAVLDGDGTAIATASTLTDQVTVLGTLDGALRSARTGHAVLLGDLSVPSARY